MFGDITQLIVTDKSYVIYDEDTKAVLFFSSTGKFMKKIKAKGDSYITMSLDENSQKIVFALYDYTARKTSFQFYSITGEQSKTDQLYNSLTTLGNENIISLENNYYAGANNLYLHSDVKASGNKSDIPLIKVYKGSSFYKSLLFKSANFCKLIRTVTLPNIISKGSFYVTTPFDYVLYEVNKDTALKKYQFIFPQAISFSKTIIDSVSNKQLDIVRNTIAQDHIRIRDISNIIIQNEMMYFKLNFNSYLMLTNTDSRYQYNFIYNMKTSKLFSFERLTPDKSTYYLPFMGGGKSDYLYGITYHSGFFYSKISSLQMFSAKEQNAERNLKYPLALQQYFKAQNRKSNPVIVKMKIKDF